MCSKNSMLYCTVGHCVFAFEDPWSLPDSPFFASFIWLLICMRFTLTNMCIVWTSRKIYRHKRMNHSNKRKKKRKEKEKKKG